MYKVIKLYLRAKNYTQLSKIRNDGGVDITGYRIMKQPFLSFPIEEMKKKQVEQHFNWYMTQIEGRIKQLNDFINLEKKDVVLDKTPESRQCVIFYNLFVL